MIIALQAAGCFSHRQLVRLAWHVTPLPYLLYSFIQFYIHDMDLVRCPNDCEYCRLRLRQRLDSIFAVHVLLGSCTPGV